MPRGIQLGQNATDALAAMTDAQCKRSGKKVLERLKTEHGTAVSFQVKLRQADIPGGIGACAPDGFLWSYKNTIIAAFEAKKQQDKGNAIERWFKNNYIVRTISPHASYVTFACGEGARKGGVIHKALAVAHLDGFDVYAPGKNSCYLSVDGFTEQMVEDAMYAVICERITSLSGSSIPRS